MKRMTILAVLLLALFILPAQAEAVEHDRVDFVLVCNEGMHNDGGNSGNTMMVATFDLDTAEIRLMMLTWDTFIYVEGYDVPQLTDQPYRINGPEGTMEAINDNFGQDVEHFLSLNYLNLANLIDAYGGVEVDITRSERNALNAMVSAKKEDITTMANIGILEQMLVENLASEYYLEEWGEDVHLNGLQAVAFGWLQYDSVTSCCIREGRVISDLFSKVGRSMLEKVVFYTAEDGMPELTDARRPIDLYNLTDDDRVFLMELIQPIFDKSYHNLTDDQIVDIALTLGKAAYRAQKEGLDAFDSVVPAVFPLEAGGPYTWVAGREGLVVDYDENSKAMTAFMDGEMSGTEWEHVVQRDG